MLRQIIKIDEEKCIGCGLCANACHEGAIGIVDGKAKLLRDDYCDGLGNCLPVCPTKAITFETREADSFSKEKLQKQWPLQMKLVPVNAPYFENANLLVAADCTAYAYRNFHTEVMRGRVTVIGCPKLDEGDYSEKLTAILMQNEIQSITVARMEVPCCKGIENAVRMALQKSGRVIPWQVITISTEGKILE